jgi:hypothetical protein
MTSRKTPAVAPETKAASVGTSVRSLFSVPMMAVITASPKPNAVQHNIVFA